jgi:CBS domain-containing protein
MVKPATQRPSLPRQWAAEVGDVMHRGVITCAADASAETAARTMAAHRIHAVLAVTGDGNCVSVIEAADVVAAAHDGSIAFANARAIGRAPVFVDLTTPLRQVIQLMRRHDVEHVVVTQPGKSRPIGVVSILDAIEAL